MRAIITKAAWQGHSDCQRCGIRKMALFAELVESDFSLLHDQIGDVPLHFGIECLLGDRALRPAVDEP